MGMHENFLSNRLKIYYCFVSDGKKLCKKTRIETKSYILKHFKDGEFHKDYDRRETVQSMITFLRDPTGDLPWDEDPNGVDVYHVNDMGVSVPE